MARKAIQLNRLVQYGLSKYKEKIFGALALLGVSDDAKRLALKLLHHEL